ncbi:MAG: alpha/beta fold hydrolase [Rhodospirillales bacterium]|nr:alpha/beta fold hydrolase [Rhodospirillales bacterium]
MTWASSLAALKSLNDGSLNWSPPLEAAASALKKDLQGINPDDFRRAVEAQTRLRLADFASGVRDYRNFKRTPRPSDPPVIWSEGTTRLLDFGTSSDGQPILFVPSLVNRGYILDLGERHSLMADLSRRGFRPLLIDWGAPGDLEAGYSLEDYIGGRLVQALQAAYDLSGHPVALAGYCMGGLLALGLAAIRPEQVSALVLMATPWDFHAMDHAKTRMLKAMIPAIESMLEETRTLPVDVLQAMFASLDPQLCANKFRSFNFLNKRSARARLFVALEDWLNDGVPLAGPSAMDCLHGWYVKNEPGRGAWKISGQVVEPAKIKIPSLVIVPLNDRIVPPQTALPLAEKLPDCRLLKIKAGHIGMVAGSRARGSLYAPLSKWLNNILC